MGQLKLMLFFTAVRNIQGRFDPSVVFFRRKNFPKIMINLLLSTQNFLSYVTKLNLSVGRRIFSWKTEWKAIQYILLTSGCSSPMTCQSLLNTLSRQDISLSTASVEGHESLVQLCHHPPPVLVAGSKLMIYDRQTVTGWLLGGGEQ